MLMVDFVHWITFCTTLVNQIKIEQMKKFLIAIAIVVFAASCGNKQEVDKLKAENQKLSQLVSVKDTTLNNIFMSLSEVEENLEAVKQKQNIISVTTKQGELSRDVKDRIKDDIAQINELLEKNKQTIANLQGTAKKLKAANIKIDGLEKMIAELTKQNGEKDAEIASLKEQLTKLNFQLAELNTRVDTLTTRKQALEENVTARTNELNTAYFVIGSQKELEQKGIINRSGGFIGIGKTSTVNANVNLDAFTKIDIRTFQGIEIGHKNVKILSTHPSDSYNLKVDSKNFCSGIEITNSKKFWQSSKYLVITYRK
jgi:DNA repair exonuclease SbcCD ATPase subunit